MDPIRNNTISGDFGHYTGCSYDWVDRIRLRANSKFDSGKRLLKLHLMSFRGAECVNVDVLEIIFLVESILDDLTSRIERLCVSDEKTKGLYLISTHAYQDVIH
jgi:hypothetical protein